METALDVLSRAATMVQDNANEARLTSKELPTTRWRRERRLRAGEYPTGGSTSAAASTSGSISPAGTPPPPTHALPAAAVGVPPSHATVTGVPTPMPLIMAAAMRPLCESTNRPTPPPSNSSAAAAVAAYHHHHHHHHHHHQQSMESPIDMSVSSTAMKYRSSPPPPYREPLPGSTYANTLARPSVITQAPSKRERERERGDRELLANRENDNRSTESISMCETVIDEHFRRSLGPDYAALFGKKSPTHHSSATPSPQPVSAAVINTPTPTPPPPATVVTMPPTQAAVLPAYHATHAAHATLPTPQALISPKPTAVLLSSVAMLVQSQAQVQRGEALAPHLEQVIAALPPPQQQPLALSTQRTTASPTAAIGSPQALIINTQRTPTLAERSPPPLTVSPDVANSVMSAHSPFVSPRHSPNAAGTVSSSAMASGVAATTTVTMPAIIRIKTEPGASATNTPPASPTSTSSPTSSAEVIASVDDHFAKALGDTWKKLKLQKGNARK